MVLWCDLFWFSSDTHVWWSEDGTCHCSHYISTLSVTSHSLVIVRCGILYCSTMTASQWFLIVLIGLLLIAGIAAQEHQQAKRNSATNKLRTRIRRDITSPITDFGFDGDNEEDLESASMGGDAGNREGDGEATQQIVGGEEATLGDYPYFGKSYCHGKPFISGCRTPVYIPILSKIRC